ncbi:MAG: prepilin-type N-terminal cleavage/methylation domain-containing protein [Planctomycetota bacterium]
MQQNNSRASSGSASANGRRGFTLVELSIAITILMIAMVSIAASTSRMHSLRKQNHERTIGHNGLRSMAERIHAASYGFSDEPGSWATNLLGRYSPGGAFGDEFDVLGLSPVAGEPSVGRITILTDETLTDAALGTRMGMPRDLNGDSAADDADVSLNARILPVVLTIRWRSRDEVNELRHGFYVLGY